MTEEIISRSRALGFDLVGVSSRLTPLHFDAFLRWLDAGMAGTMDYMRKSADRRRGLHFLMNDARSAIVVGLNYYTADLPSEIRHDPSRGVIASYAWGEDYHPLILTLLEKLSADIASLAPGSRFQSYVDTGPVLERDFAALAGLGFFGKNTCLIHPQQGSYFFLGVLITNVELISRTSPSDISCGSCTRCLEACPTGALVEPYLLDASRCISYLTIEHKGAIPRSLRPLIGNRVFGCDECQLACPWNQKFARPTSLPAFQSSFERRAPSLASLALLTEKEFRERFAGTALQRLKRRGLVRNVAVALGNWRVEEALPPLEMLLEDSEPLVRGHAAWALGQLGDRGRAALQWQRQKESQTEVLAEIEAALKMRQNGEAR